MSILVEAVEQVVVDPIQVSVDPLRLAREEINDVTMKYWFGGSIAKLTDLGEGKYRTATRRVLSLQSGLYHIVGVAHDRLLLKLRIIGVSQLVPGRPFLSIPLVDYRKTFQITRVLESASLS